MNPFSGSLSKLFTSQLYKDLAVVSNSYSFPEGRFSCVLHPFATKDKNFRSTCMCQAYRQRSSWARIKLSMKYYSTPLRIFPGRKLQRKGSRSRRSGRKRGTMRTPKARKPTYKKTRYPRLLVGMCEQGHWFAADFAPLSTKRDSLLFLRGQW